jgi:hypothetical protein
MTEHESLLCIVFDEMETRAGPERCMYSTCTMYVIRKYVQNVCTYIRSTVQHFLYQPYTNRFWRENPKNHEPYLQYTVKVQYRNSCHYNYNLYWPQLKLLIYSSCRDGEFVASSGLIVYIRLFFFFPGRSFTTNGKRRCNDNACVIGWNGENKVACHSFNLQKQKSLSSEERHMTRHDFAFAFAPI